MSTRSVLLAAAVIVSGVALAGCGRVGAAVANVFSSAPPAAVDAHAVYRMRPGCATVAARTIRHGFTILTPRGGAPVELSGLFEGPARTGESVFRYVPPRVGETWDAARADEATTEVSADVAAVGLDIQDVRPWLDRLCGALPPGEGEPGEAVPRIPASPPAPGGR